MELGLPSDKLSELYAYFRSAPHARRWPRNTDIPSDSFDSVQFSVVNYDWGVEIPWHENDEEDDQTHSLVSRAQDTATSFALLPERVFFQLLLASTDVALLPAVPNAPDGVALFSATDGASADRFGISGGNIVTGSATTTVGSAQDVLVDTFNAIERLLSFQDTKGQPYWPDEYLDQGVTIVFGLAYFREFQTAFKAELIMQTIAGDGGAAATDDVKTGAAVSNYAKAAGLKVTLWPTPRITTNDFYIFLNGAAKKATFEQVRRPLRDNLADMGNSDRARRSKVKALQWDARLGYGVALPNQCVQVNNA